jgi:hypothetical protein
MKKFSFLVAIIFVTQFMNGQSNPTISNENRNWIKFGDRDFRCKYWAICYWWSPRVNPSEDNTAALNSFYLDDMKRLVLVIDKSSMDIETYNYHFVDGSFKMNNTFTLPEETVENLGVLYTIQKGEYKYKEEGNAITLVF